MIVMYLEFKCALKIGSFTYNLRHGMEIPRPRWTMFQTVSTPDNLDRTFWAGDSSAARAWCAHEQHCQIHLKR